MCSSDLCKVFKKQYSVKNLNRSFQDGVALAAMIQYHNAALIDTTTLSKSQSYQNLTLSCDLLEKIYGVPQLLDPGDMVVGLPDDYSIATYVHATITAAHHHRRWLISLALSIKVSRCRLERLDQEASRPVASGNCAPGRQEGLVRWCLEQCRLGHHRFLQVVFALDGRSAALATRRP